MKIKIGLFTIFMASLIFAQSGKKPKWGEVSEEEMNYNSVIFEPDAGAVVLYEEGRAVIGNAFDTHVYKRIKILNERGMEAAEQQLRYYTYKNLQSYRKLKAQTLNVENGKTVAYPVDKKSFFDNDINEYYNVVKFTFPNLKVGSIIEFEYDFHDETMYYVDAWRFQNAYPTLYSKYEIENKSILDYISVAVGDKIVEYSQKRPTTTSWVLSNLPGYSSLDFLYNQEDMAERLVFQLRGYSKQEGMYNKETHYKSVLAEWKDLTKQMAEKYTSQKNPGYAKEIAASIPDGTDETETLKNVYEYFKKNYTWNRFVSIDPFQTGRETGKTKTGNSADLNLLLNTVLAAKGFEAEMVLLSTRSHGKIITSYPYLRQFNNSANLVRLPNGNSFLIDASDMKYELGFAPLRNYNDLMMEAKEGNDSFFMINPPLSEFGSLQNYVFRDGKFLYTKTDRMSGYFKYLEEEGSKGEVTATALSSALEFPFTEIKKDKADRDGMELLRVSYESDEIGGNSFFSVQNPLISVLPLYKLTENKRQRPLEFNFPFLYKTDVSIEIPPGYKAEIPTGYDSDRGFGSADMQFVQKAEVKEGKLLIHTEFYIGKPSFSNSYTHIKSFFETVNLDVSKGILIKKL